MLIRIFLLIVWILAAAAKEKIFGDGKKEIADSNTDTEDEIETFAFSHSESDGHAQKEKVADADANTTAQEKSLSNGDADRDTDTNSYAKSAVHTVGYSFTHRLAKASRCAKCESDA